MPLAEYLASEQAREDVRDGALELGRCRNLRRGIDFAWMRFDIVGMWRKVSIEQGQDADALVVSAYYRPDGDRYVVTDLGEGWRQHRLRTGRVDWTAEIIAACDYNPYIVDTGERATAGDCENLILKASDLPDALCRVMLASLRVAQS